MWIWILVGIAVLIILFYRPRENMTNEALISTLKTFGEKGTPPSSSAKGPGKQPIYGPSANPPPLPTNNGGSGSGKSVGGPYPQIFGPDVNAVPGTSSYGTPGSGGSSPPPPSPSNPSYPSNATSGGLRALGSAGSSSYTTNLGGMGGSTSSSSNPSNVNSRGPGTLRSTRSVGSTVNPVGPGQVASDQPPPQDQAYQFNPDLAKAFPTNGPPLPFLTDFSKIQH
jgi:hypothetical protein